MYCVLSFGNTIWLIPKMRSACNPSSEKNIFLVVLDTYMPTPLPEAAGSELAIVSIARVPLPL